MEADPLSDVLAVLQAGRVRRTRLEAGGNWSLRFPALDRLKLVAVLKGACFVVLPGSPPESVGAGDCFLVGRTDFIVTSDPALRPEDGSRFYQGDGNDVLRLGGEEMVSLGGGVAFRPGTADFLLDLLPRFIKVPHGAQSASRVGVLLQLIEGEVIRGGIGTDAVVARLADVLIVEAMRAWAAMSGGVDAGWLGAISDPRIGRVLRLVHGDVAHPWTLAELAREAGMSRASFSAAFATRVGRPPLAYIRTWRLTMARAALSEPGVSVADAAARVGYGSQSAFGHAYRTVFGTSPRSDA